MELLNACSVLFAINVLSIDVIKVLTLSSCPLNVNSEALTSPVILNVVALANLSVDPDLPLIDPVTLPVTLPIKFCENTFKNCSFAVPIFRVVVMFGTMLPVVNNPAMFVSLPTNNFLAIPTPPLIMALPVLIVAESVVPLTSI